MRTTYTQALIKAQFNALNAKDNKERLGYMVAGIKDGKFYDLSTETDYGVFDPNVPDTVFIPAEALDLQRVTGAKLASLTLNMTKFFEQYGANAETAEEVNDDEPEAEAPVKEKKDKKSKGKKDKKTKKKSDKSEPANADVKAEAKDTTAEAPNTDAKDSEAPEIDVDAVVTACKEAIAKGKFKKAGKLLAKLPSSLKAVKKLTKKLAKAQK